MPLTATRHVRRMRGGAQAHLIEADDGHWYVVKFLNNPQHRRVLVNEWIAATLLEYLRISAPPIALVRVTAEFLAANPEVVFTIGTRTVPVEPGWHFGSRYPGDPSRLAVYDYLPESLLEKVANLDDFRAILPFDQWVANCDGRQSVFYRAMITRPDAPEASAGFVAHMIDHGYAFNGPNWELIDSPLFGIYMRRSVYAGVRSLDDFQPWLDQIVNFPEVVFDKAWKTIPPGWVEGDEDSLDRLLEQLFARRKRVPSLVADCRGGRKDPFPNWRR